MQSISGLNYKERMDKLELFRAERSLLQNNSVEVYKILNVVSLPAPRGAQGKLLAVSFNLE